MAEHLVLYLKYLKKKSLKLYNGSKITRKASADSPAYYIEQSDNQKVLKSSDEIERKN